MPDAAGAALEAWLRYNTENRYDGALLEYSLDGTTWSNITGAQGTVPANANRFLEGGYAEPMAPSGGFGAIAAWHGARTDWTRTVVDLADFRGRSVAFRFRFKSDSSDTAPGTPGFWVDDVRLTYGSACANGGDAIFANGFETPSRRQGTPSARKGFRRRGALQSAAHAESDRVAARRLPRIALRAPARALP